LIRIVVVVFGGKGIAGQVLPHEGYDSPLPVVKFIALLRSSSRAWVYDSDLRWVRNASWEQEIHRDLPTYD